MVFSMKRILTVVASVLLGCAAVAQGQSPVAITATVTGANFAPYEYGSYQIQLVDQSGNPLTNTAPSQNQFSGSLSSSGSLAVTLYPNSAFLLPAGVTSTLWKFVICSAPPYPAASSFVWLDTYQQCYSSSVTITSAGSYSTAISTGAPAVYYQDNKSGVAYTGSILGTVLQAGTGTPLPGAVINATQSNVGGTTQINVQNTSSDNAASSDLVATADNGSNTTNYTDCGINSSTYNQASYSSGAADDGYCLTTGNFFLGAISSGKVVTVGVGGAASTNVVATFSATGLSLPGSESAATYLTATNCTSSAAPAVCASAAAGSVLVAAAGTTVTVNTTAVTANSQIFVQEDSSLGTKLSVTCNVTPATAPPTISARVAATSFTITTTAPTTNPRCFSYSVLN